MPIKEGFEWMHKRARSFNGIGDSKVSTLGKRQLPVAFKLKNSGLVLPTAIHSHEQKGNHPLLLSDPSQAALGMIKNMRLGIVYLEDYDDYLQVYRAKGTGLKVICVSNFPQNPMDPNQYVQSSREKVANYVAEEERRKRITQEVAEARKLQQVIVSAPSSPESVPILVANVGTKEEKPRSPSPERKPPEGRFPIIYVGSFGLEIAGKCKKPPRDPDIRKKLEKLYPLEWTDFVRDKLRGKPENWNSGNKGHVDALKRRYVEDHPELIDCVTNNTMVVIDAKHMVPDPDRDKSLQGHKGLHPMTMDATSERLHKDQITYLTDYLVWWTELFDGVDRPAQGEEKDMVIITVCNKMRHRSIASRELILQNLKQRKQEIRCEVCRIPENTSHWTSLCPSDCPECSWKTQERKDHVEKAVDKFGTRFESELKGRSLWRGHYAKTTSPVDEDVPMDDDVPMAEAPELYPEEEIEAVPARRIKKSRNRRRSSTTST